jgi:hypothetical protein
MDKATIAAADADCLRAVANALTFDQKLIAFLRDLAPQWGSSTGKTRSFGCESRAFDACGPCILRVDSRVAIALNDALYSPREPSRVASHLADSLRHAEVDETGRHCRISTEDLAPILLSIVQYSDAEGNAIEPDSPSFHHRVVSIVAEW